MARTRKRLTFEEAAARLEEIAAAIEGGENLSKSVELYAEGVKLAAECREGLDEASARVLELRRKTDGSFALAPFDGGDGVDDDED